MKVAIYGQPFRTTSLDYIIELSGLLLEGSNEVLLVNSVYKLIKTKLPTGIKTYSTSKPLDNNTDFMISVGGDGTMLRASGIIQGTDIPVIGINTGRMGFLANVHKEEMVDALKLLENKQFKINKRSLINVEIEYQDGKKNFGHALNEITVGRKNLTSMISIKTRLNGQYLNTYWADGLIISTPTGSTGYSLSCNGPIIIPNVEALVITPIAPHNLSIRPLVIKDDSEITLEVNSRENEYLMSIDSRVESLPSNGTKIHLKKAKDTINMIELDNHNFLNTLREKLFWGKDIRH